MVGPAVEALLRPEALYVGSVKSNMGHCEGGSGIAGLVKLALSAQHGCIPGNLHFEKPNHHLDRLNIKVVTEPFPLHSGDRCAVSSFGFGGRSVCVCVSEGGVCGGIERQNKVSEAILPLQGKGDKSSFFSRGGPMGC